MTGPTIADVCCCGGTASDGYALAGWSPSGFDVAPQPLYPYRFRRADARAILRLPSSLWTFDAWHWSPPCQLDTRAQHLRDAQGSTSKVKVDLLEPVLEALAAGWAGGRPWVVENVEGPRVRALMHKHAPYVARLCGSSFGLAIKRHRLFASNVPVRSTVCRHDLWPIGPKGKPKPWGVYHVAGDRIPEGGWTARDAEHARELFGLARRLPWDVIKEGFPPAYTAHVGADLWRAISGRAA